MRSRCRALSLVHHVVEICVMADDTVSSQYSSAHIFVYWADSANDFCMPTTFQSSPGMIESTLKVKERYLRLRHKHFVYLVRQVSMEHYVVESWTTSTSFYGSTFKSQIQLNLHISVDVEIINE